MPSIKDEIHGGLMVAVVLAGCLLVVGCHRNMANAQDPSSTPRDINAVLADHDDELLAIPGVVGVYVGLMDDGQTTCLKVMLVRDDPAVSQSIPETLEGYPVIKEVGGEIRPMGNR